MASRVEVLTDIRAKTAEELQSQFRLWGEPAYRARQVLEWLYVHRVTDWEAMTNLPGSLRGRLRSQYALSALELLRLQGSRDAPVLRHVWTGSMAAAYSVCR